jgi:hypothetical protein
MRTGYKLVRADLAPFVGDQTLRFGVGTVHRLPDGVPPIPCEQGFHYCPVAVDCLGYLCWHDGPRRLMRVKIPDDATVVTDDGVKFCASVIEIVEEVISDAAALLTGGALQKTHNRRRWMRFVGGKRPSRGLLAVDRYSDGTRWKMWVSGDGPGPDIETVEQLPSGTIRTYNWLMEDTAVEWTDAAWVRLNSIMDAREPCEEQ